MTLEEVETTEQITHVPHQRRSSSRLRSAAGERLLSSVGESVIESPSTPLIDVLPGGLTAKHEAVATEQLTKSSCEERQRFVIKAVLDPRNNKQLTMQVCVRLVNPDNNE